jgi:MFS family permease
MTSVALPALAPALRDDYGLSLRQVGVVLAAVSIGMLVTLLPWGLLADRFDERAVIAVGLAGAAAGLAAAAQTRSFGSVTGWLIVAGALGASVNAASGRAVMAWFPPRELGLALGIRQTAIPIGGALGAALLPVLASTGGTRLAFRVLGASCAVGAVLAAAFMRAAAQEDPRLEDLARPLRDRGLWRLASGTALYLTAQIGITGFVVLFLHEHRHVSTHTAGGLLALINVLAIGTRIASGHISDRLGTRLLPLRTIGVACALATAVVAAATDAPLALLAPAFVTAGVLSMSWNALGYAAAAEFAGAGKTGAALGFQQTVLGVMSVVVPPGFALVAASSWRAAFAIAAVGPFVGFVVLRAAGARSPGTSAIPPAAP